jgi:hypothetical protein
VDTGQLKGIMTSTSDTYNQAMAVVTSALANWGNDEEKKSQYLRDVLTLTRDKSPQELMIMMMALGQTAVGFLQLAAEQHNVSPEELLQDVALNILHETSQDE